MLTVSHSVLFIQSPVMFLFHHAVTAVVGISLHVLPLGGYADSGCGFGGFKIYFDNLGNHMVTNQVTW